MNPQGGISMEEELDLLRCLKGHVIKSYKGGKFCDLTIKSKDGKEIKAHKLVLYAQNSYFARKLDARPDLTEIEISKFSGEILQTVVDLIYFRTLSPSIFTKENVLEYLKAGDTFLIDSIRDEASVFMAKNMDVKFALDMIQKPIFEGKMADDAINFIAEHFQEFLSDEKLKKRLLSELKPGLLADILSMKNLMLWNTSTGRYLTAVEREKQLFFIVLAYVAQEKERFDDLKMLLSSLKMPLLVSKRIISIHMIGAGLKKPVEVVSGKIGDILEPFENLEENYNLAALTKDKKDKKKDKEDLKIIAESCRMRYGSIPHTTHCSDVNIKLEPWSKVTSTRSLFCPGPFKQQTAVCKKEVQSITVYVCRLSDLSKSGKGPSKSADSSKSADKDDSSKAADKDEKKESSKEKSSDDKEDDKEKEEGEKKDDKGDDDKDKSDKKDDSEDNKKDKDNESEDSDKVPTKEKEGDNSEAKDDKKEEKEAASKEEDNKDDDGEWIMCGIAVSDGKEDISIGKTSEADTKSKKFTLEPTEFVTEIYGHFVKEKIDALDSRGKKKELAAQELLSIMSVEDLSFKTNQDRVLGPVREGKNKVGTVFRLPKQILRLEKDAVQNYWWLQGFGMETLGLESDPPESRPSRFYPIWSFQSAFKYYPAKYEGFEFVAGVKKQQQFSVKGVEETCSLMSAQDLEFLERTPVHEVVDLGDSDDEDSGAEENGDDNDEGNDDGFDDEDSPSKSFRMDQEDNSVMIVDSDSEAEGEGDKQDGAEDSNLGDSSRDEDRSDDKGEEFQQGMMMGHHIFGSAVSAGGGGGGGKAGAGGGDADIEPIEIPSSSDDSDNEESGRKGKRKTSLQNGSAGKKKRV